MSSRVQTLEQIGKQAGIYRSTLSRVTTTTLLSPFLHPRCLSPRASLRKTSWVSPCIEKEVMCSGKTLQISRFNRPSRACISRQRRDQ